MSMLRAFLPLSTAALDPQRIGLLDTLAEPAPLGEEAPLYEAIGRNQFPERRDAPAHGEAVCICMYIYMYIHLHIDVHTEGATEGGRKGWEGGRERKTYTKIQRCMSMCSENMVHGR